GLRGVAAGLGAVPRPEGAGRRDVRRTMAQPRCGPEVVMSDARTAILDRIARAVSTGRVPGAAGANHELPHRSRRANGVAATERSDNDQDRSVLALRERFVAEARALGIETFVEATAEAVRDRLVTIIGNGRVLSWNPDQLPYGSGALIPGA